MNNVMYWSELAELTHATQVEKFNFCMCENNEGNENPYPDCPSNVTYRVTIEILVGSSVELDESQLGDVVCDELSDLMRSDILSAAVIKVMP